MRLTFVGQGYPQKLTIPDLRYIQIFETCT